MTPDSIPPTVDFTALLRRQADLLKENELLREKLSRLIESNAGLSARVAALESAGAEAQQSRRAVLNLLEDTIASRQLAEQLNEQLRLEVQERRQAEEIVRDMNRQLQEALQSARAAHRAKDDFIAALSHELRTPLTPVLLLASHGACDDSLPEATRESFEIVRSNVEIEARLIDDLLDQSRVDRGEIRLCFERADLHRIVEDAVRITGPDFAAKGITPSVQRADEPAWVQVDPVRIEQVLWNLLRNAAKFTPAGGTVSIRCYPMDEENFAVGITDSGIGLTPEERERVFDAFVQGDHASDVRPRFGGLGLGLSISRQLVELHHGKLTAESAGRGQGCSFTLVLPVRQAGRVSADAG